MTQKSAELEAMEELDEMDYDLAMSEDEAVIAIEEGIEKLNECCANQQFAGALQHAIDIGRAANCLRVILPEREAFHRQRVRRRCVIKMADYRTPVALVVTQAELSEKLAAGQLEPGTVLHITDADDLPF